MSSTWLPTTTYTVHNRIIAFIQKTFISFIISIKGRCKAMNVPWENAKLQLTINSYLKLKLKHMEVVEKQRVHGVQIEYTMDVLYSNSSNVHDIPHSCVHYFISPPLLKAPLYCMLIIYLPRTDLLASFLRIVIPKHVRHLANEYLV